MYIVEMTVRRKNARRHVHERFETYEEAVDAAVRMADRYDTQVLIGRWEVLNEFAARYTVSREDEQFFDSVYGSADPDEVPVLTIGELYALYSEWGAGETFPEWLEAHFNVSTR